MGATAGLQSDAESVGPLATSFNSVARGKKEAQVRAACARRDASALIEHATSALGFVDDRCRCLAWPILLGCDNDALANGEVLGVLQKGTNSALSWERLPAHTDEHQVSLDVDRSFVYYPKGEGEKQLAARKEELGSLITQTLRQHPYLAYFQGYHDIVQVFLLVLGRADAVDAVARLSLLRIRDFMLPTLAAATAHLDLIPHILHAVDPGLGKHLSQTQPFFALPATLTLYAHEIQEYGEIARLFDFFLAQPASVPVYFFATVVQNRREELLEVEQHEPEMLHAILCKLPKPLDLEQLIAKTMNLYSTFPPSKLPGRPWQSIDKNSVLKTTENIRVTRTQTLKQGHEWFQRQMLKVKRDKFIHKIKETMWAYRRPVRSAGVAVAIVLIAWWLNRQPNVVALTAAIFNNFKSIFGL